MINQPQSSFGGPSKFNIDKENYFYYKVVLNYDNYDYKIYRQTPSDVRVGVGQTANDAITWYEYINP